MKRASRIGSTLDIGTLATFEVLAFGDRFFRRPRWMRHRRFMHSREIGEDVQLVNILQADGIFAPVDFYVAALHANTRNVPPASVLHGFHRNNAHTGTW